MKESEKFDEPVARKAALQDEINELEVRIAEEESRAPPAAPPGPPPAVHENFPFFCGRKWEDMQMEGEVPDIGAGVGAFVSPSKKKVIRSFWKRASLRLTETRSSVFAKICKLSSQDFWMRLRCRPRRRMMHKARSWGNISRRKSSGNEEDTFFQLCCAGLDLFPGLSF